ncbi:hypothetical protein Z517_07293 [Fonsecaea pedrosoi CBS 271.37]|uniref:Uncharacterized protein n=1 Tax=Fonsecaea pedrosoi CBS 271.37 TaxID=1442368 RepID=A0A0D2F211_9EURO|nr:uncharacterized protein Z517_07293 [Fonsecaea pedrosoi CBS 271.37]KIW80677.1 hypothetical protein Z517_07293 [Fonsecaea pedrosoi CBS 271.37]
MDHPSQEQMLTDERDPPPRTSPLLPPLEEAMHQDGNAWVQSFSNLRYGIMTRKRPEEIMSYQGVAEHKLETDPEMTRRYQLCLDEQKAQYIRQKLEEQKSDILSQRRVEQEATWHQERQRELRAQQQLAFYTKQYPRYPQFYRREGLFRDDNPMVNTARQNPGDTDAEKARHLDKSMMSSPSYHFVALDDTDQEAGAATPKLARTQHSTTDGPDVDLSTMTRSVEPRIRKTRHNTFQSPYHTTTQAGRNHSSELPQTPSAGFTPAASGDEANFSRNMMPLTKQGGPHRSIRDEPTPPYHPDDQLSSHGFNKPAAQRVKSPTLSDLIGSETPSENDDDDTDGDYDFDPKSPSPEPPKHRDVKSFGQRNRKGSRRTRR